jgi:ATP adenylyltransferase
MNYLDLKQFLLYEMTMSHIYQPLVIRTLLENKGQASVRQIATEFLSYDEAQVQYYIKIVKRWPRITLKKHGIIESSSKGIFRLTLNPAELETEHLEDLINICNEKIREYLEKYNGIIGDYRYNPNDLSSSNIRYLVLKLAHGKCALCGASIKDTPIDIDHIVPRNKGGSNELSNLQALCYRCNRAKRDRDSTDFRDYGISQKLVGQMACRMPFLNQILFSSNRATSAGSRAR